jgi:hypothetical protein
MQVQMVVLVAVVQMLPELETHHQLHHHKEMTVELVQVVLRLELVAAAVVLAQLEQLAHITVNLHHQKPETVVLVLHGQATALLMPAAELVEKKMVELAVQVVQAAAVIQEAREQQILVVAVVVQMDPYQQMAQLVVQALCF